MGNIERIGNLPTKDNALNKIDLMVENIHILQEILDHRTEVENQALALISKCKFQEAILLLNELDNSELDLYI